MDTSRAHPLPTAMHAHASGALPRTLLIGLIAFLTVIDLFGTQAILPALTRSYGATPAAMGLAVNASTLGMAVAGLGVAYFSRRIDRRRGILAALTLLAIPTALLAFAPNLPAFAALRIAQGLCMASAFGLTLAYLGEHCSGSDAAGAFSAYIAGNVASNLFGRLLAAGVADHLGLAPTFFALALLNLAGAALVRVGLTHATLMAGHGAASRSPFAVWAGHLADPRLRAAFGIGFCILFAFIGTFTYVTSCWCGSRSDSTRCPSASSMSCSCPRSGRLLRPGSRRGASASVPRFGAASPSPQRDCRSSSCRAFRPCSPASR
jgi:MFS family permease